MATKRVVTITSTKDIQPGELHRSSANFTLAEFGRNAEMFFRAYYDFGTDEQLEAEDVMFDIWIDEPMLKDPVYVRDITTGHAATNTRHPQLYIANPRGAKKEFTVVAEYGIRVDSQSAIMDDHKHRSSMNFATQNLSHGDIQFHTYYHYGTQAQISAPKISFSIRQNKLVLHPPVIWKDVTDGTVVRNQAFEKLYVADPQGAVEPFTVIITMA